MAGILDEFLLIFRPQVQGTGFQKLNNQIKQTHNNLFSVKNLMGAFIGYDVYSGIKAFAGSLIQASKDLGAMTSRFYAITKSEKSANEELQWTFDLAKRTAMGLKETADSYSIFYAATQKGLGTEGARKVFQDWTEVSRVLHLSTYQFERVTYALREMASKGAIYSQDLRMQIGTHVPNAMGLAEKAVNDLGITGSNWFDDFREQAKGNQKLINQFIVLFSKYAKEMYASPEALAKAMQQPDAQIQTLLNHFQEFRYAIVKSGFEKDLVGILSNLNRLLDGIVKHTPAIYKMSKALLSLALGLQVFRGLSWLANTKFIKEATYLFMYMAKNKGLLTAIRTIAKGTLFTGLGTALKGLTALLGGAGLAGLTALFTTPQGWVILGLTAIISAVVWFKKTFPNAWLAISNWVYIIKTSIELLITKIKQWLFPESKEKSINAIDAKRKDIEKHGGYFGNDKYGGFWDVFWLKDNLRVLEGLARQGSNRQGSNQQRFNIVINNTISGVENAQEVANLIEQAPTGKQKIQDFWGNIFKKPW